MVLVYQWVVGHFPFAGDGFGTGELVREDHGDEILGIGALELRRVTFSREVAFHRQGNGGIPAPAGHEHRSC